MIFFDIIIYILYNNDTKKEGGIFMFEEGFGGFGFEFQGESEDGKFYCDSVPEFQMLTKFLPLEETGLSFSGEVLLDDNTSVITDKQVKMNSPEDSVKTYLKVMEMRDLSEAEVKHISKYKLFFNKLFEVFFRGQKWRRNLCGRPGHPN